MKLERIITLKGQIELLSGLHIGASEGEMRIGGVDNQVIKHPYTDEPYIPGSSLKGKMRSLLEWRAGLVGLSNGEPVNAAVLARAEGPQKSAAEQIARLFGIAGAGAEDALVRSIGPTRLSFWDCALNGDFLEERRLGHDLLTEAKTENAINRVTGVAENPRQTERVPAGARFDFQLTLRQLEGDGEELVTWVLDGLRLIEMDAIGGSGSRGYGKVRFSGLTLDGESVQERFEQRQPFGDAA